MRALDRMGLRSEVERLHTRTGKITVVDRLNRKIASLPDNFTSGELEIMRGDLAGILYEATRNGDGREAVAQEIAVVRCGSDVVWNRPDGTN